MRLSGYISTVFPQHATKEPWAEICCAVGALAPVLSLAILQEATSIFLGLEFLIDVICKSPPVWNIPQILSGFILSFLPFRAILPSINIIQCVRNKRTNGMCSVTSTDFGRKESQN